MISENNKKFLRKISFLANFSDEELNYFFEHLDSPISLPNGHALITDGTVDKNLYIIIDGEFSIYKKTGIKNNYIAKVHKAEVIGEISEYVGEKRSVSVIASADKAKVLKVDVMKYPLNIRLKIRENYCNILAKRLIAKNDDFLKLKGKMTDIITNYEEKAAKLEMAFHDKTDILKEQLLEQERIIKQLRSASNE